MTSRALVTGAGGFVGRHVVDALERAGYQVAAAHGDRPPQQDWALRRQIDVGDVASLTRFIEESKCDVVFHLAARVDTVRTPSTTELYRVNTLGTAAVLEAIQKANTVNKVILASSAFAYGRVTQRPEAVTEDTPLDPVTAYGASKAAAETLARQWSSEHGINLVVARPFQISGPGHSGSYALAQWAAALAGGANEVRVGNLDVIRDYVDVRDVANGLVALASANVTEGTYNVASGRGVRMADLLDGLIAAFGGTARVVVDRALVRASEQRVLVADISRIKAVTGWEPRISTGQMLLDLARSMPGGPHP